VTFELVAFPSYEVEERARYLGKAKGWIGGVAWKALDRSTVETLAERKV